MGGVARLESLGASDAVAATNRITNVETRLAARATNVRLRAYILTQVYASSLLPLPQPLSRFVSPNLYYIYMSNKACTQQEMKQTQTRSSAIFHDYPTNVPNQTLENITYRVHTYLVRVRVCVCVDIPKPSHTVQGERVSRCNAREKRSHRRARIKHQNDAHNREFEMERHARHTRKQKRRLNEKKSLVAVKECGE
uniref:Uncharacterized protein n=1 Tax=Trichogramma kaykai TaxID=54128 RepID=A0ABD2XH06_9HYME